MKILNRISLIFVLSFALLAGSGHSSIDAQDTLPDPPGELIDVGGYQLHIYCMGEGSPTVLLDTAGGILSLTYYPLEEQIAEFTRVCTYDRAGYGWSDPATTPRTLRQMSLELETLLKNAGVETPVILMGNSIGGILARYFAATRPDQVAGVLLLDATPPLAIPTIKEEIPEFRQMQHDEMNGLGQVIGLVRDGGWSARQARGTVPRELPIKWADAYAQLMGQPHVIEAIYAEHVALLYMLEEALAAGDLGDTPLIVLAGRNAPINTDWANRAWERWIDFQEEQAAISTNSRFEALDSGHFIYLEMPDVVVAAVRELMEGARSTPG